MFFKPEKEIRSGLGGCCTRPFGKSTDESFTIEGRDLIFPFKHKILLSIKCQQKDSRRQTSGVGVFFHRASSASQIGFFRIPYKRIGPVEKNPNNACRLLVRAHF
jgi:hypothetical protein